MTQGFKLADVESQLRYLKINSNSDTTTENIKSIDNILIFQRQLGHKVDIPDSGRWQMLTNKSQKCWICDRHVYGYIFWSRDIGQKTGQNLKSEDREFLLEQL